MSGQLKHSSLCVDLQLEQKKLAMDLVEKGISYRRVASMTNIPKSTIYSYVMRKREETGKVVGVGSVGLGIRPPEKLVSTIKKPKVVKKRPLQPIRPALYQDNIVYAVSEPEMPELTPNDTDL